MLAAGVGVEGSSTAASTARSTSAASRGSSSRRAARGAASAAAARTSSIPGASHGGKRISRGSARAISATSAAASGTLVAASLPVERSSSARPRGLEARRRRLARVHCGEVVVGAGVELVGVGDGAGRDDAHDLARDDALDLGGVGHLLADRDLVPLREQARDVAGGRVVGDARHGDRVGVLLAGREGEVEDARDEDGVVVEGLVEVAHAEEDDRVRVRVRRLLELAHDGRELPLRSLHGAGLARGRRGSRPGFWKGCRAGRSGRYYAGHSGRGMRRPAAADVGLPVRKLWT